MTGHGEPGPAGKGPVLVTGGTGFIGSRLAERLASSGRPVRVISRRGVWPWGEPPEGLETVALDLADRSCEPALVRMAEKAGIVVHLAGALYRAKLPERTYRDLHVGGTLRMVEAVRAASADQTVRLVHVSTTGVLGPTGPDPLDETAPPGPETVYERSKLEGERIALSHRGDGLEVVVIRPGLVYGPRDLHLLALFRSIASGSFRLIGGGKARWQPIHVDDVVRGIERATVAGNPGGGVYHLAGSEPVTVASLVGRIAALLGRRVRGPGLPVPAAMAAGWLLETACRPMGIDPPLSRSRVRTLTQSRLYDVARAERELGFTPAIPLNEGLANTVAWYREHGYLETDR